MPELLWKTYIDFEINEGEYDLARKLYERLLEKTTHVKVRQGYVITGSRMRAVPASEPSLASL